MISKFEINKITDTSKILGGGFDTCINNCNHTGDTTTSLPSGGTSTDTNDAKSTGNDCK